ncbi:MAG: hypothetical protein WB626_07845 [Bacteroidota bacterium]
MSAVPRGCHDRFESITRRDFQSALIRLLKEECKVLGSRQTIPMLADDLEDLQPRAGWHFIS